jgi:predicted DNA-binding transcriptional regulator YafY
MFSDEELEAIALGLRLTAEHADAALERAAGEVVAKLRAVLPKDLQVLLSGTGLLAGPARSRPRETVDLGEVRRALRAERKVRLEYSDQRGTVSSRVVWPVALGFFERSRVLVGWCETRHDFRSFRVDRIARFTALGAGFPKSRAALLRAWREREGIPAQLGEG